MMTLIINQRKMNSRSKRIRANVMVEVCIGETRFKLTNAKAAKTHPDRLTLAMIASALGSGAALGMILLSLGLV